MIQLAGDYFGVASIDTAVAGADRAARALVDRLSGRGAAAPVAQWQTPGREGVR